jgi:hypothetical protein
VGGEGNTGVADGGVKAGGVLGGGVMKNHTKFSFHLTICSGRPIGAIDTIAEGQLPVHYDRPPATNYL